jgi:hypothetical protein
MATRYLDDRGNIVPVILEAGRSISFIVTKTW